MRYLWILLTTLLVVAAVGVPLFLWARAGSEPAPVGEQGPLPLEAEAHYYVFLTRVEVDPKDGEGSSWDLNGSPDLAYEIKWQGETVFSSTTKDDTLLAKWSTASVKATDLIDAVSLDDSIKAARITARPGDSVEFVVYDRDTTGDDLVGSWIVPIEQLRVGDQSWERPGGRVRGAGCRVLPLDGVKFESLTR